MKISQIAALAALCVATLAGCGGGSGDLTSEASSAAATAGNEVATSDAATTDPTTSDPAATDPAATTDAGSGAVRYLALGDSLSQGVGAPDESTGAFPAQLAERWRAAGCDVELKNVGISGYTAAQIITDQLPEVESFAPTVITFQTGANDIVNGVTLETYRKDVDTILDAAQASGARVLVLLQNEWFNSPEGKTYGENAGPRAEFDEVMVDEATKHDAELVDLRESYAREAADGLWVEDGIHPNEDVYAGWADQIAEMVGAPC